MSEYLNRPIRTEAQAREAVAAQDAADPDWRERWDREVNGERYGRNR